MKKPRSEFKILEVRIRPAPDLMNGKREKESGKEPECMRFIKKWARLCFLPLYQARQDTIPGDGATTLIPS